MNSILVFVDLFIIATPVRLVHVYQTILAGIYYILFSLIYYAAGGTDETGNPYIYDVLDWSDPGAAALVAFLGCLAGLPLTWIAIFALYRVRCLIGERIQGKNTEYDMEQINGCYNYAFDADSVKN